MMSKINKKILFTANLDSFFIKFLIPQLKYFKEQGYEIHIAAKSENIDIPYCDKKFDVCFARSLNIKQNITSLKQMKKILSEEHYELISCHTPFGGAITRIAAKKCNISKKGTKIVYMAHGFHFYKGAPLINWLLYYNVEKKLANYTDTIITINLDDYKIAKEKFKTNVEYVKGVGLIPKKFDFEMPIQAKEEKRKQLGIKKDDFVMIYPAELLPRKRQIWLIKTINELFKENKNFHLLLPGKDSMKGKCQNLIKKLGLEKQIHILGFRKDIPELIKISDLAVSSSKQEGLPVNIMEVMYCGLPVVATSCRGNRDVIVHNENGYLVDKNNQEEFVKRIMDVYMGKLKDYKKYNKERIQMFLLENVIKEISSIYEKNM